MCAQHKEERINIRVSSNQKELLCNAANIKERTLSTFILETVLEVAQQTVMSQNSFSLSSEQWNQFIEALDKPRSSNPALEKLLLEPSVLEAGALIENKFAIDGPQWEEFRKAINNPRSSNQGLEDLLSSESILENRVSKTQELIQTTEKDALQSLFEQTNQLSTSSKNEKGIFNTRASLEKIAKCPDTAGQVKPAAAATNTCTGGGGTIARPEQRVYRIDKRRTA